MEDRPRVKFDGKHWIAKRPRDGPFLFYSYKHVAQLASRALGRNGIVAIPNARPTANQPDPECRYEEFFTAAQKSGITMKKIDDGRAFYDFNHQMYFMKAHEVRTDFSGVPVVFLAYNLPFERNLNARSGEEVLDEASSYNCILGITIPSCIRSLEQVLSKKKNLLRHLDFVVVASGIETLRGNNPPSLTFYEKYIEGKTFKHPYSGEEHFVGGLYVSGGHRTPKKFFGRLLSDFQQTIGSSYSLIPEPSFDSFAEDMRKNVQNAKKEDGHLTPIRAEARRHGASLLIEKYLGYHPHFK